MTRFMSTRELLDKNLKTVFGEDANQAFEQLVSTLTVFCLTVTANDVNTDNPAYQRSEHFPAIQNFIRKLIARIDPWELTPNYVIFKTLVYLRERIHKQVALVAPSLDYGCGDGLQTDLIFDDSFTVGLDILQEDLDRAKLLRKHGELVCGNGRDIPYPDNYFRTVVANHTLYHIPQKTQALREIYRVMASGGGLYFDDVTKRQYDLVDRDGVDILKTQSSNSLAQKYEEWLHTYYRRGHWDAPFSGPQETIAVLEAIGFKNCSCSYFMSRELMQVAYFMYDLTNLINRQMYYRFNPGIEKLYFDFLLEKVAVLIDSDHQICQQRQEGNWIFVEAHK